MIILVIGAGYVGLVTAAGLSEMGHRVICLDVNSLKIEELKKGNIPIYEPLLEEIIKRNLKASRLVFTTDYKESVSSALVCFLAVETPSTKDGSCDISYIKKASSMIAEHMTDYKVIVNKSTVPVGTQAQVKATIRQVIEKRGISCDFDVVSNPEFLKEGDAVNDFMKPDRVIIGVDSPRATTIMKEIYSPFMLQSERMFITDVASAEMIKYAANAMLATRISFMNELSRIAEANGADINEVRKGIGSDHRTGPHFLYAGIGYGGSCLPKDVMAFRSHAQALGVKTALLDAVDHVNEGQKEFFIHKIKSYWGSSHLNGKTVAILGLSFKPNTDDMRHAPSIRVIRELQEEGMTLRLFDPVAMENAKRVIGESPLLEWCQNEYEASMGADGIVLLTEWKQFRFLDFPLMIRSMKGRAFFDARNQYVPKNMSDLGFDYHAIGKAVSYATPSISNFAIPVDLHEKESVKSR